MHIKYKRNKAFHNSANVPLPVVLRQPSLALRTSNDVRQSVRGSVLNRVGNIVRGQVLSFAWSNLNRSIRS